MKSYCNPQMAITQINFELSGDNDLKDLYFDKMLKDDSEQKNLNCRMRKLMHLLPSYYQMELPKRKPLKCEWP